MFAKIPGTLLFVAALSLVGRPLLRADCSLTSTGVIPLNDLGPGSYHGVSAGLYPAGSNTPPAAHAAAALTIATDQIKPLNASGNSDPVNGRIVMISIGMSNTTQEFATKGTQNFKLRAEADPAKNPQLVIVDGAQGGQDAPAWTNPTAPTWGIVNQRLTAAGVTPQQVQVAWLKQALAGPLNYGAFPAHAQALQTDLEIIVRNLKTNFPNIRITYLSPRSRAYTNIPTALNPEPFAYETGFAVKWTIADQINGVGNLNFDPANGAVVAPLILWGPYIWADGLTPRSDGFTWLCPDLEADFTHPTASGGVPKVGLHLLVFFKTDPTATPWFLKRTVVGQPPQVTAGASVSSGPAPLSVNFTANATDPDGTIVAYQWTFDDGTFSAAQNPAKIFPAPGNYAVHLTVTDDSGNTTLRTLPISVAPAGGSPTPTPTLTPAPATPTPTLTPTPTPPPTPIPSSPTPTTTPTPPPPTPTPPLPTPTPASPSPTPPKPTPSEPPQLTPTPTPTSPPDPCHDPTQLHQTFDVVTPPTLPAGWISSFVAGPADCTAPGTCPQGSPWVTNATNPFSGPYCAFHDAPSCVTDSTLDTPSFFSWEHLTFLHFWHSYDLESGFDGAVLEISINGGPFIDFIAAGGSFSSGGYNGTIATETLSPIAGRAAWTGNSGGYIGTSALLPAAPMTYQSVRLRFRLATDCHVAGTGWRIDTVETIHPTTCQSPTPTPTPAAQSINLSTRMRVETGANVGIGGFIVTGTAAKHVLLRAIGPSLGPVGVPNVLADPIMELHGPAGFVTITNDNWRDDPAQEAAIIATGIPPPNNLESALDATLPPGAYTAIVKGKNSTAGVALVEVYDLSPTVTSTLANISTRAFVGTGDNLVIAGFILGSNNGPGRIILRGIGPSLTAFGVPNALNDPTLELRDSNGAVLVFNNNWQDNPAQVAELFGAGLAPKHALESAIVAAWLPPGSYTALLAGTNNSTGVGLIEVYDRGGR